jgi:hypothetical protein
MNFNAASIAVVLLLALATGPAHATPYFSQTGAGPMGNAEVWGDSSGLTDGNTTDNSVILELVFDFTIAADNEVGALLLWEAGDTTGSSLTIKGDELLFASRAGNVLETVSAAHGLTAPQAGVQVVTVIDLGLDISTVYVNGSSIGSGPKVQGDWSGGESAELGFSSSTLNQVGARPHDNVPGYGPIADYPDAANANFSFDAYLLDGPGNALENILIPEPSSLALLALGGLLIARFRRR